MAFWLCKVEPGCYSIDDLVRDGSTMWDGVSNALARIHLRNMKPGDRVFYYHTGKEKAIVGEMVVAGEPKLNPSGHDKAAVAVEMKPVRKFANPVALSTLREEKSLASWDLLRISRLSVVPVTKAQWNRVEKLSEKIG